MVHEAENVLAHGLISALLTTYIYISYIILRSILSLIIGLIIKYLREFYSRSHIMFKW